MASLPLYDAVVPSITKGLKTFDHILTKTEEYANENNLNVDEVFVEARLIEDQKPLVFQVQNISKIVRTAFARLTGKELDPPEDNEKTFAELHKRIQSTLELVQSVDASVANGRATEPVELAAGGQKKTLTVQDALLYHSLPNFFFHLVTAYSILRAKGVPLGKFDYLGSFLGGL
ncbi:hypothetical protein VD0002_g6031 [Verticillium dahliae]|uniref:DUF1993 domain-containing protein n=2 Tax=Verticillium dahliae TaxID=27337 RepID=G2XB22_VERDV|nr:uncharacterized protein VDAG_07452 [Verticillium dahliae VdLs.17]KAF3349655.1 UPF0507 protein [Verticillium dahliae VDG2]KAH6702622.1 hypothetical protein EV126DRAFT_507695 [Verticillium dahliae]EGY16288.1 hypothetical protein VDAG_07452 [Verticillium dahliae VdLs.17]PNH36501.1 hypothetical protein BJF96_g71 [Verticillium dahliae]PNH49834.1 hypothetical protein VD0003_g7323 [Verticillium dahliae]